MARFPKRLFILGFILLPLLICLVAGYVLLQHVFQPANCLYLSGSSVSPQWFKDFARIDLPASARNISATCEAFQDYVAYARFTIDPSDLNGLIASSLVKTPLSTKQKPLDMRSHDSDMRRQGWNIESISSFLAGEGNIVGSTHQSILIDTSDATHYTVYIVTFSV